MNSDIIFSMGVHTYVAKIKKIEEEGGYYLVEFPSLRGCITYGRTIEETIAMAKDALEGYLLSLKEDGKPFPVEKSSLIKKGSKMDIPLSVSFA
jgi:predicted RNase H-like HicB family nuclease